MPGGRQEGQISDCYAMGQKEVAERLGVSRQYVNALEQSALRKLRRNKKLRELFDSLKNESNATARAATHPDSRSWFTGKFGPHWNTL